MTRPTYKSDIFLALADCIVQLGKNNFTSFRFYLKRAETLFEQWIEDRPEKKQKEAKAA